jgi:hypothetical protein
MAHNTRKVEMQRLLLLFSQIIAGLTFAVSMTGHADAQQQYKILSAHEFLFYDRTGSVSSVKVFDLSTSVATSATTATLTAPNWWDVTLPADILTATNPSKSYIVTYSKTANGKTTFAYLPIESMSPKLTITVFPLGPANVRHYMLSTNVALMVDARYLLGKAIKCPVRATQDWNSVVLVNKDKTETLPGRWHRQTGTLDDARANPLAIGSFEVCLDYSLLWRQRSFSVDPASAANLFPQISVDPSLHVSTALQFADAAAFSPQSGPASKSDAVFYANLQIAAGTGAAGAWGLDGKVALFNVPFLHGSWTLASATANTGNNTSNIKNTTYTDTIDWTLPGSWAYSIWTKRAPTTLTLVASPDYETDREFDKQNFLFSGDSIWTARKLYQPQSYRSIVHNGVMPKYGDPDYASYGYELEFHAGVESGGALIVTTVKNTQKTASIKVPTYEIERVVPQIHGLFQKSIGPFGLLSFDSSFKSRYLFDNENTVRQSKSGALSIKQVSGWKAINTLTSTWNPPKNNNVGITVTYKDGFDAPKFSRVNSVLAGVLIQF